MSTLNPTLPTSSFIGNADFTWWLGTVKNADDKDAKLGRVKVNILGYHKPGESPENLPWAMVLAPTDSAGANGVGSAGNQLKPGSFVVGFFLDYPDCQQPVVIGSLLSKIKEVDERDSQAARDYPRSYDNVVSGVDATNTGQSSESMVGEVASTSVAAATAEHSAANPSGQVVKVPVADGKNAGDKTFDSNVSYAVGNIVTMMSQIRSVKDPKSKLKSDIDSEEQTIPLDSADDFPIRGIVKIGSELIGYNNKSGQKLVLAKRGFDSSKPQKHERGTEVRLIMKSEYLGENGESTAEGGDIFGTFTDTLVDVQGVINTNLEFIKDSIWWLVNQIKSYIMGEVTKILNAIGIAAISPFPMFGKILTDAIMFILREIACILDESLVDLIFGAIEDAIMTVVDALLDILDAIQCIFNAIFDTIFNLVDIVSEIFSTVNSIIESISSIGDISSLSSLSQINVTSILDFIFGLLGIGCNRDTRDPFEISFSSCPIATLLSCSNGTYGASLGGVKGRWNPEYSKIIGTFSETGTMVVMDDTPYNTRLVIEHGPSKSGIHVYDNGDVRITNSAKKTEVTIKDQEIIVHGNVKMTVDGDYHLKVGRDYHLEVLGMYNLAVNRESKISYAGEHSTFYKNDSRIEANNGLALVASKLGISCSGQYELQSPISTTWCTEQNHFALGSYNVTCLYQNNFIGLNKLKIVGGNNLSTRIGTNFEQGIGTSSYFQLGLESEFWGGKHNQTGIGAWLENKLAIDAENTIGVTAFTKAAASFDAITGAAFKNTTGIFGDTAEGLKLDTSAAICYVTAPIVAIN